QGALPLLGQREVPGVGRGGGLARVVVVGPLPAPLAGVGGAGHGRVAVVDRAVVRADPKVLLVADVLLADHDRVAGAVGDGRDVDAALHHLEGGSRVVEREGQDLGVVPVPDEDAVGVGPVVVEPVALVGGVVGAAPRGEEVGGARARTVATLAHHGLPT